MLRGWKEKGLVTSLGISCISQSHTDLGVWGRCLVSVSCSCKDWDTIITPRHRPAETELVSHPEPGETALLVKCSSYKHKDLSSSHSTHMSGLVTYT